MRFKLPLSPRAPNAVCPYDDAAGVGGVT